LGASKYTQKEAATTVASPKTTLTSNAAQQAARPRITRLPVRIEVLSSALNFAILGSSWYG